MRKLRVLSLFAGIGGFDLGLERTGGFETVAVAELDPYASKILALRFPNAPNVGDVTKAEYPDADIICAGFPCQDISYAGEGAGLAGSRSGLFREVVRAVRVVRPAIVFLENVAALLGRGLDVVPGELAALGYDAEWHCIPASAVGAPHRRDRIWIVAHAGSEQHQGCRAPISGALAAELSRTLADASRIGRREGWSRGTTSSGEVRSAERSTVADSDSKRGCCGNAERQNATDARQPPRYSWHDAGRVGQWATEPDVGRVADGVPKRVDRLRCLGNAVVPQIPELIGNAILASLAREAAAA